MVNFFQDYKLEEPKPEGVNEFAHSVLARRVSADHAPDNVQRSLERTNDSDEDMDVEDKAVNSLYDSISKLDPDNPIDKKIMRRVINRDLVTKATDGRPPPPTPYLGITINHKEEKSWLSREAQLK